VKLDLDRAEDTIVVPSDAVVDRDDIQIVYIVEDDRAVERQVQTGLDTGDRIQIVSGISEGDKVIVEGQQYVSHGVTVKVVRGE